MTVSDVTSQSITNAVALGDDDGFCGIHLQSGNEHIGETIDTIRVMLKKSNSPTGTLTAQIRNNGGLIESGTTLDVSTLTTSYASKEFTFSGTNSVAAGSWIGVYYDNGSSSNRVFVGEVDSHSDFSNAVVVHLMDNGSYSDYSSYDLAAYLSTDEASGGGGSGGGGEEEETPEDNGSSFNPEILQILQIGAPK